MRCVIRGAPEKLLCFAVYYLSTEKNDFISATNFGKQNGVAVKKML